MVGKWISLSPNDNGKKFPLGEFCQKPLFLWEYSAMRLWDDVDDVGCLFTN